MNKPLIKWAGGKIELKYILPIMQILKIIMNLLGGGALFFRLENEGIFT